MDSEVKETISEISNRPYSKASWFIFAERR
jgi:hypothetical protein